MTEKQDALDAMSSEFIAEIKDDLASLETDLLAMEEQGEKTDEDLINHAFRAIHSIKGGAGFLNFKPLSGLSHAMESVLMRIREKKLGINSRIVDALLSGFDKMKSMVETAGSPDPIDYSEERKILTQILEIGSGKQKEDHPTWKKPQLKSEKKDFKPKKKIPAFEPVDAFTEPEQEPEQKPGPGPEPEPKKNRLEKARPEKLSAINKNEFFQDKVFLLDADRLNTALNHQKYLYAVCFEAQKDLIPERKAFNKVVEEIKSIGDILYADDFSGQTAGHVYFVIATILDYPLLKQVLEIDHEKLSLLDRQFTDIEIILKGLPAATESAPGKESHKSVSKETFLRPQDMPDFKKAAAASRTIRINVDLISRLMNRAGELVLSRNQLRPVLERMADSDKSAGHMMQNLDMVTTDIQQAIMQMRMQPVIDLLGKYKRVVRDIARRMDKKVELVIEGADVEVDRTVLEKLANPVTHIIRNSIDHGIESPQERVKASKPETGVIRVRAYHQGGQVHLVFSDDGKGIDPQMVLSKAYEKGLVTEEQVDRMTEKQKLNLIFTPGFSTSERITDISGRGVGMDVVRNNIEHLRGQIEIDSQLGQGTRIHLIIPLTLAIVPSLIVSCGQEKFAIPQVNIKEVLHLEPGKMKHRVERIGGSEVMRLRDELLPIVRLRTTLGMQTYVQDPKTGRKIQERRKAIADRRQKSQKKDAGEKRSKRRDRRQVEWDATYIIIVKMGWDRFGLCVDAFYDIEEVVVEPLSGYVKHLKYYSGASILGDGNVIMTLDISGIAAQASLRFENVQAEAHKRMQQKESKISVKGAEKRNLIVFSGDDDAFFAFELADISRLEPIQGDRIHITGGMQYIEHHHKPVLLISMDMLSPAGTCDLNGDELYAIFPKKTSVPVGVLASKIIDTFEIEAVLQADPTLSDIVKGTIFIENKMIRVLDHQNLINRIEKKISFGKEKA